KEAGYTRRGTQLVDANGQVLRIDFLGSDPSDFRITGPFIEQLRKLGIDANPEIIDQSQYINRIRNFDFDIVTSVFSQSQSPGNEQRDYWSSAAAATPGSRNLMGISDPVIDALIE